MVVIHDCLQSDRYAEYVGFCFSCVLLPKCITSHPAQLSFQPHLAIHTPRLNDHHSTHTVLPPLETYPSIALLCVKIGSRWTITTSFGIRVFRLLRYQLFGFQSLDCYPMSSRIRLFAHLTKSAQYSL
ncbi:hypothetical protein BJ508DRAFT_164850 [Ascobolus immersus RN42]|uniref:Uncharacterized protein n=1 Tax=Ascobolus immersus RN42 TaxID=1160509 RepID=A0A3N4I7A3_ASCIM|nr:hypothetical protein BJ508DRAFT_164850 [Ascobolus immersus RN42]